MITFKLVERSNEIPDGEPNSAYLKIDHWNDFSYVTMFNLYVYDEDGVKHDIGSVKIGFVRQDTSKCTYETLDKSFDCLPNDYFSLGQDIDYYQNLASLSTQLKEHILKALNDMVFNSSFVDLAQDEGVFRTSLLRSVSLSVLKGQFKRVLDGLPPLTGFQFSFERQEKQNISGINLSFSVEASSTPSTNIHAIIGRNGVGKTTLLNNMINAITSNEMSDSGFYSDSSPRRNPIDRDYFSSLVSVSFSAFDPFEPPSEQADPSRGTCYFYIGLKDRNDPKIHCTPEALQKDCAKALTDCFQHKNKAKRWNDAINKLSSDENFDQMNLAILQKEYQELGNNRASTQSDSQDFQKQYYQKIQPYLRRMSSGHAIILLTITKLVATVEEKTLVLLDEPESHLHPPLLSAFVRALSDLLYDRNGVAIIATHSPVVLQEVPKSCVWKLHRVGSVCTNTRPDIETFGENVGTLTREVFGLEVSKSGFHDLLTKSVEAGDTYQEILAKYQGQLGTEGRILLKTLVVYRDGER
jgi:predicted ATPase